MILGQRSGNEKVDIFLEFKIPLQSTGFPSRQHLEEEMCDIVVTFNQIFRATLIPTKPTSWLHQDTFVFEENPALSFYPRNLRQITMVESNALLGVLATITSNLLRFKKFIQDIPLWIVVIRPDPKGLWFRSSGLKCHFQKFTTHSSAPNVNLQSPMQR